MTPYRLPSLPYVPGVHDLPSRKESRNLLEGGVDRHAMWLIDCRCGRRRLSAQPQRSHQVEPLIELDLIDIESLCFRCANSQVAPTA
jgi:hypothetical protein